jgi:hypothetical protein
VDRGEGPRCERDLAGAPGHGQAVVMRILDRASILISIRLSREPLVTLSH